VSCFLGQGGQINTPMLQQSDDRVMPKDFMWDFAGTRAQLDPWADGMLWPRSRFGLGGADGFFGGDFSQAGRYESDKFDFCGGAQIKKLIGTSRDSSGVALGSCLIQGFLTANDVFVGQCTSDSGGYFELPTPYTGAHYLVAYKAGSPDVAGTTVNTLIPV